MAGELLKDSMPVLRGILPPNWENNDGGYFSECVSVNLSSNPPSSSYNSLITNLCKVPFLTKVLKLEKLRGVFRSVIILLSPAVSEIKSWASIKQGFVHVWKKKTLANLNTSWNRMVGSAWHCNYERRVLDKNLQAEAHFRDKSQ